MQGVQKKVELRLCVSVPRQNHDLARIFMKFWDFRKNISQIKFLNQPRATPVLPRAWPRAVPFRTSAQVSMSVRANLLNMCNGISGFPSENQLLGRFWAVFPFWCRNKKAVFFFADTICLRKISKKWIHMSVRANLLNMCNGISGFQSENQFLGRFW